jgi:L-alanine-DL-glutamate epimerase-like enolase superfamily enzyme
MIEIEAIKTTLLFIPLKKKITTNLHTITHITCLYLRLYTKQGVTGHCLLDGLGNISYQEILDHLEKNIVPLIKGHICHEPAETWQRIWETSRMFHANSAWRYALAAIDIALWDAHTKEKNISLHRYLGGIRNHMSVYGSSGWLSLSNEELLQECQWYASQGVNAFKVRLGHQDDIQRISLLRETMGEDFIIMVDANQRYTIHEAIDVANKISKYNIFWFEEPISSVSVEELTMLANKISIPIALGENVHSKMIFKEICVSSDVSYMQPDFARVGGISVFLEIARIVEKSNRFLCSHLFPELSASILSVFTSACLLEHDNCLSPEIFTQDFTIHNGEIKIPTVSGAGVELRDEALSDFGESEVELVLI